MPTSGWLQDPKPRAGLVKANRNSAQVFAADFYETAFASNPRSQETWDRYMRVVLEAGGSRDELMVMQEFLGHVPTPDALVRNINLG